MRSVWNRVRFCQVVAVMKYVFDPKDVRSRGGFDMLTSGAKAPFQIATYRHG